MSAPLKVASPQALLIYQLLSQRSALTAKEIGDELNIMPNAVYRAVRHLIDLGVVQQHDSHPVRYGVKIRVLLQKRNDTSPDKLRRWLSLGAEIRLIPDMSVRMFIFDSKVVYLTSYSQSNKEEAFGLRFKYQPLAIMLNDVFEQRWQQAEPL